MFHRWSLKRYVTNQKLKALVPLYSICGTNLESGNPVESGIHLHYGYVGLPAAESISFPDPRLFCAIPERPCSGFTLGRFKCSRHPCNLNCELRLTSITFIRYSTPGSTTIISGLTSMLNLSPELEGPIHWQNGFTRLSTI